MAETTKASTRKTTKSAPATKGASKKVAPKKVAPKKTTARAAVRPRTDGGGDPPRKPGAMDAALRGARELIELTGKELEGIVGISKDDDGWTVQVEVLEMRRIPSTTDVLAVYEAAVDGDGGLLGYRRADRYVRGSAGEARS